MVAPYDGFPTFTMGIVRVFHCDWIDCRGPSRSVVVFFFCNGLNIAENKA